MTTIYVTISIGDVKVNLAYGQPGSHNATITGPTGTMSFHADTIEEAFKFTLSKIVGLN